MNKSQRIYINKNNQFSDNHIIVKLDQDIDTLEFLSMNLSAKDVYQNFNADYGVLIGRVLANGGVGIPNAKISIFIPLTDEDAINSEISSIYPYVNPTDKNNEGKRYNLLPRVSQINPNTGVSSPKQPFGSFPIKPELVTNQSFLNVYKKYYKYTALTNSAGDYMIFGVPTGTQTVHMSVDITDIGKYSMTPAAMVTNLGYSPNLFTENGSKIKPSTDLSDLPNIETQEISVDIVSFWGDTENFTIGITRQDFRVRSTLINTFTIFGSVFTDGDNSLWGEDMFSGSRQISEMFRAMDDANRTVGIFSKRIGNVTEKIYYYPATITDTQINSGSVDPTTDMILLDPSEYSIYKKNGDFAFIISCNRNKVVTDEFGNEIAVSETSSNGVFTKFRGFITLEITSDDIPMNFSSAFGADTKIIPFRYILKFPQSALPNASFNKNEDANTTAWRKQHYIFTGGSLYSIAKFHGLTFNNYNSSSFGSDAPQFPLTPQGFFAQDVVNKAYQLDSFNNVGIIVTGDYQDYVNSIYQFPSNSVDIYGNPCFGGNWMNFSVYLPQLGQATKGYSFIRDVRSADNFQKQNSFDSEFNIFYFNDNTQPIAAGQFNTKWFARSDLHWTDFIEVPKTDIITINSVIPKGFTNATIPPTIPPLIGNYRNGALATNCPYQGGRFNGGQTAARDNSTYFFKGLGGANCIEFITSLGLV